MSSKECLRQAKLHDLERNLINYFKKQGHSVYFGGNVSTRDIINMGGLRARSIKPDGYYLFTIGAPGGKETHGIIIEKRISQRGETKFILFDPNGKNWANKLRDGQGPCGQHGGSNEYGLCIKFGEKWYDLDKSNTPDKAWNITGQCSLWNLVMLVVFVKMKGKISEILREFSYIYPRDEYNFYNGLEIVTKGDVFMVEFIKYFYSKRQDFASEKEIKEFIDHVERSINIFLRTPYELDYTEEKRTIYTTAELNKFNRPKLLIICKVRMYKECYGLTKADLISNILEKQEEMSRV